MTSYILDLFRRSKKPAPRVELPVFRQPIVPKVLRDNDAAIYTQQEISATVRLCEVRGIMDRSTDDDLHEELKLSLLKCTAIIRQLNSTIDELERSK